MPPPRRVMCAGRAKNYFDTQSRLGVLSAAFLLTQVSLRCAEDRGDGIAAGHALAMHWAGGGVAGGGDAGGAGGGDGGGGVGGGGRGGGAGGGNAGGGNAGGGEAGGGGGGGGRGGGGGGGGDQLTG